MFMGKDYFKLHLYKYLLSHSEALWVITVLSKFDVPWAHLNMTNLKYEMKKNTIVLS